MKKLIYSIFLLIPTFSYADSITSGSVGFLKPSTGVVDTTRSWADKLNANWDIAAATFTTVIIDIANLQASTSAFDSKFDDIATATTTLNDNFNTHNSTTDAKFDELNVATTALANATLGANVVFSSNIAPNQVLGSNIAVGVIGSSHTIPGVFLLGGAGVIQSSNVANSVFVSSAQDTIDEFLLNETAVSAGSCTNCDLSVDEDGRITSQTSGSAGTGTTLIYNDEGSPTGGGNVTSVDCVGAGVACSQSGSSVTVTVVGGGGGASSAEIYMIVVGTSATRNAQVVSTTTYGFEVAITSVGGYATPPSSGSIYVQAGTYITTGTVELPFGITMVFEDGAIIKNDLDTNSIGWHDVFAVSGTIRGDLEISISTNVFGTGTVNDFTSVFNMGENGRVEGLKNVHLNIGLPSNTQFRPNGYLARYMNNAKNSHIFGIRNSSLTFGAGTHQYASWVFVDGSTGSSFNNNRIVTANNTSVVNRAVVRVPSVDNFDFDRNIFIVGLQGIIMEATPGFYTNEFWQNMRWTNNVIEYFRALNTNGFFYMDAPGAPATSPIISSGTVFNNNAIYGRVANTAPIFGVNVANTTQQFRSIEFNNNYIQQYPGSSGRCFHFGTNAVGMTVTNNRCNGTVNFITDGGSATYFVDANNLLGSTEQ